MSRIFLLFFMFVVTAQAFFCTTHSCNPTISYAMGKERAVTHHRMSQFYGSINTMKAETNTTNKFYTKEIIELLRWEFRLKIRLMKRLETNHLMDKLREINSLTNTTNIKKSLLKDSK